MTLRERALSILAGRQPDAVPWFGDLDYFATSLIKRGLKPTDFKASSAYIDWHRDLGIGYYLQGYWPFHSIIENCQVKEWTEGESRYKQVETPHGTLRECWQWLPASFAEAPQEHLVKSAADLPAYRHMIDNTRYEPDYDFAHTRLRQVGDAGVVLCYLPKSPLMQLVALDAGLMTVVELFSDATDEFEQVLDSLRKSHDMAAQIALESPAEVLMIPENLSSECIGPKWYDAYMRDYEATWAERIAQAGKYSCIHLDGSLKGLLRQVCSIGLTFIEALTPCPVGDLAVEDWAGWIGGSKTVLWGGLPGSYFTDKVSDAEFDRHVKSVLQVMRSEPRYVLGVADQVPPDGLERRLRRVSELIAEHGRY